jgi:hypothetical protein
LSSSERTLTEKVQKYGKVTGYFTLSAPSEDAEATRGKILEKRGNSRKRFGVKCTKIFNRKSGCLKQVEERRQKSLDSCQMHKNFQSKNVSNAQKFSIENSFLLSR